MTPLISILLPCRRPHRRFLIDALRSVARQTSPDWRLIAVVDDDSDAQTVSEACATAGIGAASSDPAISARVSLPTLR